MIGQSNTANFGQSPMTPKGNVYNFYDGHCYRAVDPLLGATGIRGSVWTRLGRILLESGRYKNVIIAPAAVGGTGIREWAPGGQYNPLITSTIESMLKCGLKPTHILWHQGETDAVEHTPKKHYMELFRLMLAGIRAQGVKAPIYVSVATYLDKTTNEDIKQAQRQLIDPKAGILPGPDTDRLGPELRFDRVHFSDTGLERFALMWAESIGR